MQQVRPLLYSQHAVVGLLTFALHASQALNPKAWPLGGEPLVFLFVTVVALWA